MDRILFVALFIPAWCFLKVMIVIFIEGQMEAVKNNEDMPG